MNSLSSKHPLLVLRELESIFSSTGAHTESDMAGDKELHAGLGIKLGEFRCIVENNYIEAVLLPDIVNKASMVPGTKPWFIGLTSLKGQALPLIDFQQFLLHEPMVITEQSRVLVIDFGNFSNGIIVSGVMGLLHFSPGSPRLTKPEAENRPDAVVTKIQYEVIIDDENWPVLAMNKIGKSPEFQNMAL